MDTLTWSKNADIGPSYHPLRRPAVRASAVEAVEDVDNGPARTCLDGTQLSIYQSFEECESLWRTAVETCSCFVFQTFEWLSTWYATIGQAEGVRAYIVRLADDTGRTLLILPLGIYRRKGLRFLCFLGGVVTDYNVALIDPEFASNITRMEFSTLWERILDLLPGVDVVWLQRMPDTIEGTRNPMIALAGTQHTENTHAPAPPPDLATFKARRGIKLFSENRRRRVVPADVIETLETMARQKSRRWRESGARDLFALPGYLQFYKILTNTSFQMGSVHISCLQLNGRTLATHWGLVFKRRFYSLMSGYQAGEWRYSVGRLLLENVVEWCISEKINVFDLTVGDESYKFDWTDNEYPYPSPAEAFHVRAPGVDYFDRYATALQPCRSEIIAKLSCDLPIVFAPMIGYRAALYLRKSRVVFAGRHAISASRRRIQTSGLCPDLSTLERAKDYDEATSQDFSLGFLLQVCSPLIWEQYK